VKKSVQLDSVLKTVDDKLSTWSSVVAKNSEKKAIKNEMKKRSSWLKMNRIESAMSLCSMFRNGMLTIEMSTMMDSWLSKLCREQDFQNHTDTGCKRIGAPGSS
jgi:hypothetical protein